MFWENIVSKKRVSQNVAENSLCQLIRESLITAEAANHVKLDLILSGLDLLDV